MEDKLYIKKFIRDDGETLSFDGEEIYLAEKNTLLVRANPATTAVEYTESDGGEMIRQRNATYTQTINGLIVPKTSTYWDLETQLSLFFKINHTYKIIYVKKDGSMFAISDAWISMGLQIVPVPHETYSEWSIDFTIGNNGWREYMEDESGKEIYANNVVLPLISAASGGEVWESVEGEEISGEGSKIVLDDTKNGATISDLKIKGDTEQQIYTGKNLLPPPANGTRTSGGIEFTVTNSTITGTGTVSAVPPSMFNTVDLPSTLPSGTYTFSITESNTYRIGIILVDGNGTTHSEDALSIPAGDTSVTITTTYTIAKYRLSLRGVSVGQSVNFSMKNEFQLETGSTPTAIEPYVGSIPAPNPDYPQDIHVVAGEQIVKIGGKNLWGGYTTYSRTSNSVDFSTNSDGSISMFGTASATAWSATGQVAYQNGAYITLPAGTYYLSTKEHVPIGVTPQIVETTSSSNIRDGLGSFTLSKTTNVVVRLKVDSGTSFTTTTTIYPMIEIGSSATTYQPYQSQSYTVDLGSIELAKIGTHQDYIYKSGDDWYIHKEIGKLVADGSEDGWNSSAVSGGRQFFISIQGISIVSPRIIACDNFYYITGSTAENTTYINSSGLWVIYKPTSNGSPVATSTAEFKTWLSTHNTTLYYVLATPTITQITNNTIIGELEALAAATGYNGQTIITASPSGTNLPAILAVTMQNPTISGEVWDNVGTEWEMGNGGVQTVNIASTQAIYPVWVVEGPCINPKLQNNTTDTIAEFDGTVATGQTLTVDFEAGTAYLDSALVTRYVAGIVSFAPGENMAGFNSDGGATQESTISWNNIIN